MFKRLIFEDYAAVCTIVSFFVVAAIFLSAIWRAIRMPRKQIDRMANLPFETNPQHHDNRA